VSLGWTLDTHCLTPGGRMAYPERFLKETQPGRNLNSWALQAGYKFSGEHPDLSPAVCVCNLVDERGFEPPASSLRTM
jgi:hypothetical protein